MEAKLKFTYDREADILHIDKVSVFNHLVLISVLYR